VVVLAGTVSADPVQRRMPSGDEVTELRFSVPEVGKRHLPLPVAARRSQAEGAHAGTGGASPRRSPAAYRKLEAGEQWPSWTFGRIAAAFGGPRSFRRPLPPRGSAPAVRPSSSPRSCHGDVEAI
jgi:hypothetical protein